MNKKGFTLIELLAVILILAIIAAIISPIIGSIIDNAKEQSDKRSAERFIEAAKNYYVEAQLDQDKSSYLGTNIIDKLDLENVRASGVVVAHSNGTTEMAIVINSRCFTKTATQDIVDIEVSKDTENCTLKSSGAYVASTVSGDTSIDITINDNGTGITMSSCKYSANPGKYTIDGTISGNTCTLSPTTSGTRYYYEIVFSDGSKISGSIQGGTGSTSYPTPGSGSGSSSGGNNGGNGGSGSGSGPGGNGGSGNQWGGIAGPIENAADGRTIYVGRMISPVITVYFNVTTGEKCDITEWSSNSGAASSNKAYGLNSGCMKFFAYMEDDTAYTMISDRNLPINVGSETVKWTESSSNATGPVTATAKLKTLTDSWLGTITPKDYINVYMSNGSETAYKIKYETDGYKARLITTDEIARITGNNSFNSATTIKTDWFFLDGGTSESTGATWQTQIATASEPSAYKWLFNYTKGCSSYGCSTSLSGDYHPYGYWTSDAIAGSTNLAWQVNARGRLDAKTVPQATENCYNTVNTGNAFGSCTNGFIGIRPVITVLKSTLQ